MRPATRNPAQGRDTVRTLCPEFTSFFIPVAGRSTLAYHRDVPTAGDAGVELCWERRGHGEALLLIQGMRGTHLTWGERFLSRLEPDFDCVLFDNRGIGNSADAAGPFTIADLAADALAVMDAAG